MECSNERGEAKLIGVFHLSLDVHGSFHGMEKTYCTIVKMEISILYHVIINSQLNRDNLTSGYIKLDISLRSAGVVFPHRQPSLLFFPVSCFFQSPVAMAAILKFEYIICLNSVNRKKNKFILFAININILRIL